jgi:osmotically-inducible protein OsmY
MRTDHEVQADVLAELRWEPSLANDDIAVSVRDGVVTLAGFAESWADRWKAERVASRVQGVKGVANDIKVKLPSSSERPDPDIAHAAVDALKWNVLVPDDRIRVKVSNGWLTLEGEVDWYYQKEEAERAVRKLKGVKGVTNLVTVAVRPASSDVKEKIRNALERGAELDADRIRVEVEGSRVILSGTVRSYAERRDAERAARNAPGVTEVENLIIVDPLVPAAV